MIINIDQILSHIVDDSEVGKRGYLFGLLAIEHRYGKNSILSEYAGLPAPGYCKVSESTITEAEKLLANTDAPLTHLNKSDVLQNVSKSMRRGITIGVIIGMATKKATKVKSENRGFMRNTRLCIKQLCNQPNLAGFKEGISDAGKKAVIELFDLCYMNREKLHLDKVLYDE